MLAPLSDEYSPLVLWRVKSRVIACNSVAVCVQVVLLMVTILFILLHLNVLLLSDVLLFCFISVTVIKYPDTHTQPPKKKKKSQLGGERGLFQFMLSVYNPT